MKCDQKSKETEKKTAEKCHEYEMTFEKSLKTSFSEYEYDCCTTVRVVELLK